MSRSDIHSHRDIYSKTSKVEWSSVHTWLIGGYSNHSRSGKSSCTMDQNLVTRNVFHCSSLLADRLNTDFFFLSAALLLKDLHLCSMWIYIMLNFFFFCLFSFLSLEMNSRMGKSEKEEEELGRIFHQNWTSYKYCSHQTEIQRLSCFSLQQHAV